MTLAVRIHRQRSPFDRSIEFAPALTVEQVNELTTDPQVTHLVVGHPEDVMA